MSLRSSFLQFGWFAHAHLRRRFAYGNVAVFLCGTSCTRRIYLTSLSPHEQRLKLLGDTIHESARNDDLRTIPQNYDTLAGELLRLRSDTAAPYTRALSSDQVKDILRALGRSGRPKELALAEKILADLPNLFGLEHSPKFHAVVVTGLIERGNLITAHRWLVNMRQ